MSLRWMLLKYIDDKSTLAQVMTWCRHAPNHCRSQYWPITTLPYCVTWPQKGYVDSMLHSLIHYHQGHQIQLLYSFSASRGLNAWHFTPEQLSIWQHRGMEASTGRSIQRVCSIDTIVHTCQVLGSGDFEGCISIWCFCDTDVWLIRV